MMTRALIAATHCDCCCCSCLWSLAAYSSRMDGML